ncbi:MAG: DinB family protein [Bacteroidota bacterium]
MEIPKIIDQLEQNRLVFQQLLQAPAPELIRWKPQSNKWCLLEIVAHLHDEEVEDFRTRTRYTLEQPQISPPPIDPEGWVQARNYIGQDYSSKLATFLEERQQSVRWLRQLEHPQWDNAHQHPKLGPLSARFYLDNWLAHDYLHFRQIIQLKIAYLEAHSQEDLSYAGGW